MIGINLDLIVLVVAVFLLIRLQERVSIPQILVHKLRFFVDKKKSGVKLPAEITPDDSPEEAVVVDSLDKLELAMIETGYTKETSVLLKSQVFYGVYEVLVSLAVISFVAYLWSMGFHCLAPESEYSCWLTLVTLISVAFAFQSQLHILFLTGFQARESKLALQAASIVFIVTALSLHFQVFPLYSYDMVYELAVHCNALIAQFASSAILIPNHVMASLVHLGLSVFSALMAGGMVIPAIRFAQTFHTMNFGSTYELSPLKVRIMLGMDFILPLYVSVVFSNLPNLLNKFKIITKSTTTATAAFPTCAADDKECNTSATFESALMVAQLVLVFGTVALRVYCMRKHLQCFLDSLVRVVSVHILNNDMSRPQLNILHAKVKARTDYLVAACAQYVTVPIILLGTTFLLHQSSATGTGLCVALRSASKWDNASLLQSIQSAAMFNTSALAFEKASQPYFVDAIHAIMGDVIKIVPRNTHIPLGSASETMVRSVVPIQQFLLKLSGIYALPSSTAVALSKNIVSLHSLLWFVLYGSAVLLWKYYPLFFVSGAVVMKPAVPVTAAPQTGVAGKENKSD